MTFKSTLDLGPAMAKIAQAGERALRDAAEHWLTEANKNVPHDDGTLERSGEVSVDGKTAAVSYNTPYAVKQHEDMTLHHDGKGESKWLENSGSRESSTMGQIIATAMRQEVG